MTLDSEGQKISRKQETTNLSHLDTTMKARYRKQIAL